MLLHGQSIFGPKVRACERRFFFVTDRQVFFVKVMKSDVEIRPSELLVNYAKISPEQRPGT